MKVRAETAPAFLDQVKARHGLSTDYQLARALGVAPNMISRYRKPGRTFEDKVALRIAKLLELPPEYVLACMAVHRSRNPEAAKIWAQIAVRIAPKGAL